MPFNLHPTMYLLILYTGNTKRLLYEYLHPTMYLLIPAALPVHCFLQRSFTSHYVSINSYTGANNVINKTLFTSHYVSINSIFSSLINYRGDIFTSHYVSINSGTKPTVLQTGKDLHPTMYLLILR